MMPSTKPALTVRMSRANLDAVNDLAKEIGYTSAAAMGRALLREKIEAHGGEWDQTDRVEQWGNYSEDRRQED